MKILIIKDLVFIKKQFLRNTILASIVLVVGTIDGYATEYSYPESIKETNVTETQQQALKVTGVVADESGSPMPGVSIRVKGGNVGTATDINGMYTLNVPNSKSVLIFSFLGYQNKEVTVGDKKVIDVTLSEDAVAIGEVVVTALGIKKDARALGYAVSTIKASDIMAAGNTINPLTALYGKSAGVGIQSTAAGPTGGINIKIRGAAGLESSTKTRPLFVVDGVPIYDSGSSMESRGYDPLNSFDYGSGINDINAEDIESMEILKGAKASVLYGSDGANGVILITTKRGQHTRGLGINLSYQHTTERPHSYIKWQNEFGNGDNVDDIRMIDGQRYINNKRYSFGPKFDGTLLQNFDGTMTPYQAYSDNFNDLFRNGSSDNLSISISGGNDRGNMRVSYSNYKYNGIMDKYGQDKNILSFSGKMNVSDFSTIEIVSNLYNVKTKNRLGNIQDIVAWGVHRDYDYNRLRDIYTTDDGYFNQDLYSDGGLPDSSKSIMNWWWGQYKNRNIDEKIHNITSVRSNSRFTDWLSFVFQAGLDYTNIDYTTKNPVKYIDSESTSGKYSFKRENYYIQSYEGYLTFDKSFMNDNLNLTAMGGGSYRSTSDNSIGVSTYGGLVYPEWYSLDNGVSWPGKSNGDLVRTHGRGSDVLYAVSGSATLSWKQTYILEIQARNDWSSTLPKQNNSYFYPGASFTWNFSDVFKIPYLEYGKFRLSWADVGRPASRYFALKSYTIESLPQSSDVITVKGPDDLFAGDLKPERKREFETGVNLRLLDQSRLEFDFSYYTNNVYNQILGVPLSSTVGAQKIRINAGNVRNWGWEAYVKYAPIITKDYKWDITLTAASQHSKVIKLYDGIKRNTLGGSGYSIVADEGERFGEIWMYDYERDDNGNRIVGSNGLYQLDMSGMKPTGKKMSPDFIGGLMSSFYWKGVGVHVGFDYQFGGSLFSYSNYYLLGLGLSESTLPYRDESHGGIAYYVNTSDQKVKWEHGKAAPGDSKDGKVYHNGMILSGVRLDDEGKSVTNDIIANSTSYYQSFLSDNSTAFQPDALYKNNYIKLREISLSYALPKAWSEKFKLEKVTVSLNARNLFYLYKSVPNVDPESVVGTDGINSALEKSFYPTIRTYGFGINVSF